MRCRKNYWHAMPFTFCKTFKRAIDRPKTDPWTFLISKLFINGQAFIISEKKLLIFSLMWKGVQGKRRTNNYQSTVLLYWYAKTIMKLLNIYESAAEDNYWSAERKKYGHNRPKKGSKLNFLFAHSSRYNCQTFYEKKFPPSQ